MLTTTDCDVIARKDHFEVVKTSKTTKSAKPIVDAWRYLESLSGGTIGFEGRHEYGFTVGGEASKASSVPAHSKTGRMHPVTIAGLTDDAALYSFNFRQDSGVPGDTTFMDFVNEASGTNRFGIQVDQNLPQVQGGIRMLRVSGIGNAQHRTEGNAHWFVRPCSAIDFLEMEDCNGSDYDEYAIAYWDNVQKRVRILRCIAKNAGRGAIQGTNREWHTWKNGVGSQPTGQPSTPPDAKLEITDCDFIDVSSYWDAARSKWQANGSGLTLVNWIGEAAIKNVRILQTHAGGGGMFVGHDGKAGSFKTPSNNRCGRTLIERCEIRTIAGAVQQREAVMLGAMDELIYGQNVVDGTLQGVTLDHSGTIAKLSIPVKKPSAATYWGKTKQKMRRGDNGLWLSDSAIDALSTAA